MKNYISKQFSMGAARNRPALLNCYVFLLSFGKFFLKNTCKPPPACAIVNKSKNHICGAVQVPVLRVVLQSEAYGREKPNGGKKNECYFNETVTGSRCSFRTSDKKMEP